MEVGVAASEGSDVTRQEIHSAAKTVGGYAQTSKNGLSRDDEDVLKPKGGRTLPGVPRRGRFPAVRAP